MRWRLAVVAAWIARVVRGLWPDRNPLRRRIDRIEAAAVCGLAVAFLAGAPLAAVGAHHIAYTLGARTLQAERSWHRVPAVLLADAPVSGYAAAAALVPARWTAPGGGGSRTGTVYAPPGATSGSTVTVWVDGSGNAASAPPLRLSQVRTQAVLAAVFAALLVSQLLLAAGAAVHWWLARRRDAAWDAEWQATEPRWSKRKRI
jgi:hypothetical protein